MWHVMGPRTTKDCDPRLRPLHRKPDEKRYDPPESQPDRKDDLCQSHRWDTVQMVPVLRRVVAGALRLHLYYRVEDP